MSIISSVLVSAGKELIGGLVDRNKSQEPSRAGQLHQFEQRLDQAMDPNKATFKGFLSENHVSSMESIEFLQSRLKDGLLSDGSLTRFLTSNGGFSADLSIQKNGSDYSLKSINGDIFNVESGSAIEGIVDKLYRLESVLQLSAIHPGIKVDQLVDLSFLKEQQGSEHQVKLS